MKDFFRKYGWLIVVEFSIVVAYIMCSAIIDKNGHFAIVFTPEVFVTVLVGVAAIYSWLTNKADTEYERDLEMLKDIDKIQDYYKDRDGLLEIVKRCQEHIEELKGKQKYKGSFLVTYLAYVEEKNGLQKDEDEQFDEGKSLTDSKSEVVSSEQTSSMPENDVSNRKKWTLAEIKGKIAEKWHLPKANIRYSKNYDENGREWSTWYSLGEDLVANAKDDDSFIFFTVIDEQYQGVRLRGSKLKELSKHKNMKPSKGKAGITYDLYINRNTDNTYHDSRNDISLSKYGVEEIDLSFLN